MEADLATLPCVGIIIAVVVVFILCHVWVLLILLLSWALLLHGRSPGLHRSLASMLYSVRTWPCQVELVSVTVFPQALVPGLESVFEHYSKNLGSHGADCTTSVNTQIH